MSLTDSGERPVDRPALPEGRLLVADRGEQRVREAEPRVVELDDAFPHGRLERLEDTLPVSVRRRDELDRRPRERCDLEEDVDRLRWQPGEPAAEQLPQAFGNPQGPTGRRPRVRPNELASELEREERVARRRLLDAGELRPRQVETEPLLEQECGRRPG